MSATTILFDASGPRVLADGILHPGDVTLHRRRRHPCRSGGEVFPRRLRTTGIDGFEGLAEEAPRPSLTFDLDFAQPVDLHWITMEGLENCAFLQLRDADGAPIGGRITAWAPDERPCTMRIDRSGVAGVTVEIAGAGALAALGCGLPAERMAAPRHACEAEAAGPPAASVFRSGRAGGAVLTAEDATRTEIPECAAGTSP
jgi:hypothetical protein